MGALILYFVESRCWLDQLSSEKLSSFEIRRKLSLDMHVTRMDRSLCRKYHRCADVGGRTDTSKDGSKNDYGTNYPLIAVK